MCREREIKRERERERQGIPRRLTEFRSANPAGILERRDERGKEEEAGIRTGETEEEWRVRKKPEKSTEERGNRA